MFKPQTLVQQACSQHNTANTKIIRIAIYLFCCFNQPFQENSYVGRDDPTMETAKGYWIGTYPSHIVQFGEESLNQLHETILFKLNLKLQFVRRPQKALIAKLYVSLEIESCLAVYLDREGRRLDSGGHRRSAPVVGVTVESRGKYHQTLNQPSLSLQFFISSDFQLLTSNLLYSLCSPVLFNFFFIFYF